VQSLNEAGLLWIIEIGFQCDPRITLHIRSPCTAKVEAVILRACLEEDALGSEVCEWEGIQEVVEESRVHIGEFLGVGPGTFPGLGLWLEIGVEEYYIDVLDFVLNVLRDIFRL
jgi:hypothetical protein